MIRGVGELAAEEGHHPSLLTEWGRTTVSWWTPKIKGLHRDDLIMAAKRTSSISHELIRQMGQGARLDAGRRRGQDFWLQKARPGTANERPLDGFVLP